MRDFVSRVDGEPFEANGVAVFVGGCCEGEESRLVVWREGGEEGGDVVEVLNGRRGEVEERVFVQDAGSAGDWDGGEHAVAFVGDGADLVEIGGGWVVLG